MGYDLLQNNAGLFMEFTIYHTREKTACKDEKFRESKFHSFNFQSFKGQAQSTESLHVNQITLL